MLRTRWTEKANRIITEYRILKADIEIALIDQKSKTYECKVDGRKLYFHVSSGVIDVDVKLR